MRTYSPQPIGDYLIRVGEHTFPVDEDRLAAWNLIWLSIPQVDDMLDPKLDRKKFFESFPSGAAGGLAGIEMSVSYQGIPLERVMGQSAVAFVTDYQEMFDYQLTAGWKQLGGQDWLDTMMRRAYQADGLSSVYEAAASSANVILADFTSMRRLK